MAIPWYIHSSISGMLSRCRIESNELRWAVGEHMTTKRAANPKYTLNTVFHALIPQLPRYFTDCLRETKFVFIFTPRLMATSSLNVRMCR